MRSGLPEPVTSPAETLSPWLAFAGILPSVCCTCQPFGEPYDRTTALAGPFVAGVAIRSKTPLPVKSTAARFSPWADFRPAGTKLAPMDTGVTVAFSGELYGGVRFCWNDHTEILLEYRAEMASCERPLPVKSPSATLSGPADFGNGSGIVASTIEP